jgi:hypothetical protein
MIIWILITQKISEARKYHYDTASTVVQRFVEGNKIRLPML